MTIVIGLIASRNLIFASDGFALHQQDANSPAKKQYTHNKIRVLGEGKYLLGSAGSHLLEYELCTSLNFSDSNWTTERDFLEDFNIQVRRINDNNEGNKSSFILGYFNHRAPKLFLFQSNGTFNEHSNIVAIGSGADIVMNYFSNKFESKMPIDKAVEHIISSIFEASQTPTVNFLPMITLLTPEKFLDLSKTTISMFNEFRKSLRVALVNEAQLKTKAHVIYNISSESEKHQAP